MSRSVALWGLVAIVLAAAAALVSRRSSAPAFDPGPYPLSGVVQIDRFLGNTPIAMAPPGAEAKDRGATVRVRLDQLIAQRLEEAPKRGKGARRRRFLENVAAVTERYAPGLFHCYDDDQIPHTSNEIEGKNGVIKHHQRKTTGRASTVGGPMETAGELLAGAVDTVKRSGFARLADGLADVARSSYEAARRRLKELREPARRYRSIQRP